MFELSNKSKLTQGLLSSQVAWQPGSYLDFPSIKRRMGISIPP